MYNILINYMNHLSCICLGCCVYKSTNTIEMESCDEAEKEAVYQSSYSTYIFSGKLIGILLVVTMIAHLFFNTGVFAIVVVGVIYLCITVKYCVSCVKLKNKL